MPCLSLLRLASNYHYLPLFVRELSLNLQRLLKLAVAGCTSELISLNSQPVIDGSWCINTQASSPLRWNYSNVFILCHLPKEMSSGHLSVVAGLITPPSLTASPSTSPPLSYWCCGIFQTNYWLVNPYLRVCSRGIPT